MNGAPGRPASERPAQRERAPSDGGVSELSTVSEREDRTPLLLPAAQAEGAAAATGAALPPPQRAETTMAPPTHRKTPPPWGEENATRYSWLSYSTKGDNTATRSNNNNNDNCCRNIISAPRSVGR